MRLLRRKATYPAEQVDNRWKRDLIWKNIMDAEGVELARTERFGVVADIQPDIFDPRSVQVTFSAYVTDKRKG